MRHYYYNNKYIHIYATLGSMHKVKYIIPMISGEVLGALCQIQGTKVYISCKEEILSSVSDNLERQLPDAPPFTNQLQNKINGIQPDKATEVWYSISISGLQSYVQENEITT